MWLKIQIAIARRPMPNKALQRRPRSESLIGIGVPLAAPLNAGVRPTRVSCSGRKWKHELKMRLEQAT
jgi:hypothetical protein